MSDSPACPMTLRRRRVLIWLSVVLAPIGLFLLAYLLGMMALPLFLIYYAPLWWLGEPLFHFSGDIGWWFPTRYGLLATALIYSLLFWTAVGLADALRRSWQGPSD